MTLGSTCFASGFYPGLAEGRTAAVYINNTDLVSSVNFSIDMYMKI